MTRLIYLILFGLPVSASAAGLTCDHALYGAPFASVELEVLTDGALGPFAKISMYGRSHEETVTQEQSNPGEHYRLWLSQQNPNNAIAMVVYEKSGEIFPSKLINPRYGSIGREIPGSCREIP